MAGILKVDQVQSDSNLAFNIAGSNVAFMNATSLQMVGSNVSLAGTNVFAGGRVVNTAMPVGSVLQVVSATKLDAFTTSSTSPVDVTGLSVNITPTSTSSKILILAHIYGGGDNSTAFYVNIVRNSTALSVGTGGTAPFNSTVGSFLNASNLYTTHPIVFLDSPNTTSSTAYKIQVYAGASTIAVNRRIADTIVGGSSTITVMEIAG
jgi:hypothetical protein